MAARIQTLIDKRDNRKLIRDQIAAILKVESDEQQKLARSQDKDARLWALRVFTERADPWAAFADTEQKRVPIISVRADTSTFDKSGSDPVRHQKVETTYQIVCFGFGVAEDTDAGHTAADKMAIVEAERAVRFVRNILMAGPYTYLGFPQGKYLPSGQEQVVWGRWVSGIVSSEPDSPSRPVERVAGIRLDLEVTHSEFSPQYVPTTLDILALTLTRTPEGEWL